MGDSRLQDEIEAIAKSVVEQRDAIEVPEALVSEPSASAKPEENALVRPATLGAQIGQMSVGQRIKLALRGNRPARHVLLHDANALIRSMVLRNPRITEDEVVELAKSSQSDERLLRELAGNRDWIAIYSVRAALVENPKTPFAEVVLLMKTLGHHTLHTLSKSKNVPTAVASQARKILSQRDAVRGSASFRGLFSSSSLDEATDDRPRPGKPPRRRGSTNL